MEKDSCAIPNAKTKKRSAKLYVRELLPTREDIDAYLKIAYGENLHKYASFFEARSRFEAEQRILSSHKSPYDSMYGLFNKQNRLLGVFLVSDAYIEGGEKAAEVHYFIAEKFQRRGYCVKGICLLCELMADSYDFFYFSLRKENISSRCVQEKIGSVLDGSNKNYLYYKLGIA